MGFTHDDYTVAWICALPLEMMAAQIMLDEVHPSLSQPKTDPNIYILGSVNGHNVVVATLSSDDCETASATIVFPQMARTFCSLRSVLVVDIGGGVPSKNADIRLGDVVVNMPIAASGGVIQYGYGKTLCDEFLERTGSLSKPPQYLLTAISQIRSDYMTRGTPIGKIISDILQKHKKKVRELFSRPDEDRLFKATYDHESQKADCSTCDQTQLVDRMPRETNEPLVHYSLIASGNQVMKSAERQDSITKKSDNLYFKMEAAGLMDNLPCLVIRGISDYCDSHKQEQWQAYAALAAAAYTRELLYYIPKFRPHHEESSELNASDPNIIPNLLPEYGFLDENDYPSDHGAPTDTNVRHASIEGTDKLPPATDSGYASIPNQHYKDTTQAAVEWPTSEAFNESAKLNANEQFHSNDADSNDRSLLEDEGEAMGDTDSVYTEDPNIRPSKREAYISLLVDDLLCKALSLTEKPDEGSIGRIYEALPDLLKTFAMKVGSSDSLQIHRDVMVFVRKNRSEIARSMRDKIIEENSVRSDVLGNNRVRMDPVRNWVLDLDNLEDPNTAPNAPDDVVRDDHYEGLDEADRATDSLPELPAYKKFISGLPAYKWLLESIQKVLNFSIPVKSETNIRDAILHFLPRVQRVSRKEAPPRHNLTFTVEWDPCVFLQEQGYPESPERAVEGAITITGSEMDAEAATTAQYLSETWPSSGIYLLHVVKRVVRDVSNIPYSYSLPDGTQLIAWSRGPEFKLKAIGIAESIAEIGEQLAWLASALRLSPYETGVTVVNPFVGRMWTNLPNETTGELASNFFCDINFNIDVIDNMGKLLNGQCWLQLFQNPVIVKGYPIPRKPASVVGLEISLDIMAGLVETRHINIFNNKIFIKGFSTMLVPTSYSGNILFWHLLYRKNGDHISYLDSKDIHAADISLTDLETSRHILGWCSKTRYLAGAADANYVIDRSWLRGLHDNSRLKDISVSQGRLIKSNHTATYGKKDKSPQISRGTYRAALHALSKKYVVLWDVGCKRGWLMNGTNALLHLLRASLEFNKTDDLSFAFLFKPERFNEAQYPYTVSAAMEVLMNPANLNLELYEEGRQDEPNANVYFRVRDRVNDLYGTIEKILDYQIMITGERGEGLKGAPRKDLEGWDFKDIATNEDPIYPRLAKLRTIGKGWVDLTRALQAVFLFGRGFGDLIDPVTESFTCSHWETLPSNKYYLAASMEDLNRIMDRLGHPRANPPRLTKSIVWYPSKIVSNTRCNCSHSTGKHCQLAQAIWPLHMSQRLPKSTSFPPTDVSAVVFGHNTGVGWIWPDIGDPEKGEPPLSDEESDDDYVADSGIGSSVQLSAISEPRENFLAISNTHALKHEQYKIAIICALSEELMAVRALFDDTHQDLPQHENDTNTYALGVLGNHNVVAACLPCEEYGMNAASKVASDMEKSFPAVKLYFVVGIGGGVPSEKHDIRLGDIVVSTGVIQHDIGKIVQRDCKFEGTRIIQRPARSLMTAISLIRSDPSLRHNYLDPHIQHIVNLRPEYKSPGEDLDRLFPPHSRHIDGQKTCRNCKGPEIPKNPRPAGPHVHYGLIASGNQVIKDARARDQMGAEMKVLCFEMEGAGVMTTGQCLIIRGICDYADSHKNDEWHNYAAATAAAYTKVFLLRMRTLDILNREVVHIQKRPALLLENGSCQPDYSVPRSERSASAPASAVAFEEKLH